MNEFLFTIHNYEHRFSEDVAEIRTHHNIAFVVVHGEGGAVTSHLRRDSEFSFQDSRGYRSSEYEVRHRAPLAISLRGRLPWTESGPTIARYCTLLSGMTGMASRVSHDINGIVSSSRYPSWSA